MTLSINFENEKGYNEEALRIYDTDYCPCLGDTINNKDDMTNRYIVTAKDVYYNTGMKVHIVVNAKLKSLIKP